MNVLVLNCGSSSIKLDLLELPAGTRVTSARVERLGTRECRISLQGQGPSPRPGWSIEGALGELIPSLTEARSIDAVGHRVVHGGTRYTAPTLLDTKVETELEQLTSLAPLHNPANLAGIRTTRALLPDTPQIAVFDTAFHATLPRRAYSYALPQELCQARGIRRYGFHGTSHQWVAHRAAQHLGEDPRNSRIITCHLGNGASVAAVEYGRSIETSMGMTPLEGLVMGTRSGDLDPGVLMYLQRSTGMDVDALDHLLNRESGLKGLSGVSNDLRDIEARAKEGDEACQLAIGVFSHRLRKYIGAYAAVMGGVDSIVFTGGIGENSALIRHRVAQRLDFLGARLSEEANRSAKVDRERVPCVVISKSHSRTRLLVVATDEARAIAEEAARIARGLDSVATSVRIPIAISARHVHLTHAARSQLFGPDHELTPKKPLSQPGQFACEETVTLVGPRGSIAGVRVLGPERKSCQVEISRTDEFRLGVDAPVRDSGDVAQSAPIVLEGPVGRLELHEGLICARRHIHMTPKDAESLGVRDRDVVEVAIDSDGRDLVFGDVLVRVKPSYALEMHLDTDEANAAELSGGQEGELVLTTGNARIQRRDVHFD